MRLFCAIDLPAAIRSSLRTLIDRFRPLAKLSWSPADNLHVTTKFIGEWPEERIGEIKDSLVTVPKPGPILIAIRGLGWFPNERNPRVFWAGIEPGDELRRLAHDTEQALAALGVPVEDRDFSPHLTLARRRNPVPVERLRKEVVEVHAREFGAFQAESFFLYLSRAGKYTKLQEFPLV